MIIKDLKCINSNINIKEYLNFFKLVTSKMNFPEWLGEFDNKKISEILNNGGKIFIYYKNSEIICSFMLMTSSNKTCNKFGFNINPLSLAACGPIMVNPKYVGYGLQKQMLIELENYCKEKNYKYIFTTVYPDNIYSINNFIKSGYIFQKSINLSRGTRNIYLKNI